ncbi:flavoprotein [Auriscalpium vulgare]|uniref:Flavoprotein n=1 Tax=Auriscalpium vulgare TaxID=40419 RepID=A0ACB8SBX4_9AGAM|nr:flavoprotein [Auriscalpium vulgare]
MSTTDNLSVAIITCSVRPERLNPLITDHIAQLLQSYVASQSPSPSTSIAIHHIDLAAAPYSSLFTSFTASEPAIPAAVAADDPSRYKLESTRTWSAEVTKHDAFIFVTPQYNWGYPASVKHAIDLLYHEWKGKGAWVISYGGHGGGKARAQLEQVLQAIKMQVLDLSSGAESVEGRAPVSGVEITIDVREGLKSIAQGKLSGPILEGWKAAGVDEALTTAFQKYLEILLAKK